LCGFPFGYAAANHIAQYVMVWLRRGGARMQFVNPYWSDKIKIELLQKWLIIHSVIYYELDSNLIEDHLYDSNAKQLCKMQKQCPEAARQSKWWYAFRDFEGSGFYLYRKLKRMHKMELMRLAEYLVRVFVRRK
jgi:hypothetical protein